MRRPIFSLDTDAGTPIRAEQTTVTRGTSHRLAHALAGGMLHVRGMSLCERTDDADPLDESGSSHKLFFAAIVTDVAQRTDEIVFAAALLGADGTAVAGRRRSGEWTQQSRRLMRLVIEFSVDCGFTPNELILIAIGAQAETAFRLAIRVRAGENGSCCYF
jgi:hypothetical protein